jgi:preprotein translocase subunit SecG
MITVLLVIHLMVAAALVGVVLLQRSEGGALGIGGGGGGFLTGRGQANLLTRVTAALAAAFFATSILLSVVAKQSAPKGSVLDTAPPETMVPGNAPSDSGTDKPADGSTAPAPADAPRGGILDKLK